MFAVCARLVIGSLCNLVSRCRSTVPHHHHHHHEADAALCPAPSPLLLWLCTCAAVRKCHIGAHRVAVSPPAARRAQPTNFFFSPHHPLVVASHFVNLCDAVLVQKKKNQSGLWWLCLCVCARVKLLECLCCFVLRVSILAFSVSPSSHLPFSLSPPPPKKKIGTQRNTHRHTTLPPSLTLLSFFFLRASRSPCPWLCDREKCVYKTRSLADQTARTNQRLWRERQRRSEGRDREKSVRTGLRIFKFSVCCSFVCVRVCVCVTPLAHMCVCVPASLLVIQYL